MNNRGFTLVELLAVMVILIIIVSIAIPTISSSIQRTNDKQLENKKQLILSATELYLSDHKKARKKFYDSSCYIDVRDNLINSNYVTDEEITHNKELVGKYIIYSNSEIVLVNNLSTDLEKCS